MASGGRQKVKLQIPQERFQSRAYSGPNIIAIRSFVWKGENSLEFEKENRTPIYERQIIQ
jgi:hypothetical protein